MKPLMAMVYFDSYEVNMDFCNHLLWSAIQLAFVQLSILRGKNIYIGHYTQTFQPNSFIPAMLLGTIVLYHAVALSEALTMAEIDKVSREYNWLASFLTHFWTFRMLFCLVMKQVKLNPDTTWDSNLCNLEWQLPCDWLHQWHFLKFIVRGFLQVLWFPPLLHQLMVSANKIKPN